MKRYRVAVGLSCRRDISRDWFISVDANTPSEIRRAIRRLAGKKYVKEMVERVR